MASTRCSWNWTFLFILTGNIDVRLLETLSDFDLFIETLSYFFRRFLDKGIFEFKNARRCSPFSNTTDTLTGRSIRAYPWYTVKELPSIADSSYFCYIVCIILSKKRCRPCKVWNLNSIIISRTSQVSWTTSSNSFVMVTYKAYHCVKCAVYKFTILLLSIMNNRCLDFSYLTKKN